MTSSWSLYPHRYYLLFFHRNNDCTPAPQFTHIAWLTKCPLLTNNFKVQNVGRSKLLKHIIKGHCRRHGHNSFGSAHAQWRDVVNIVRDLSVGRVLRFHKCSNYGFGSSEVWRCALVGWMDADVSKQPTAFILMAHVDHEELFIHSTIDPMT